MQMCIRDRADTVHLRGKVIHRHDLKAEQHGAAYGWPKAPADHRHLLTAGLCCGTLLFEMCIRDSLYGLYLYAPVRQIEIN